MKTDWISYAGGLFSFKAEPKVPGEERNSATRFFTERLQRRFKEQVSHRSSSGNASKKVRSAEESLASSR